MPIFSVTKPNWRKRVPYLLSMPLVMWNRKNLYFWVYMPFKSSGNFGTGFIAIRAKQLLTANINRALVTCFSSCLERCHWEGKINICRSLALSRPILIYFPVSNWAEWVPGWSQMESLKVAWTFLRCIWIIKAKIDCEDQKYLCPRAIHASKISFLFFWWVSHPLKSTIDTNRHDFNAALRLFN